MVLTKPYCSTNFVNNFVLDVKQQACPLTESQCLSNSPLHHVPNRLKDINEAKDTYLDLIFCVFFFIMLFILFSIFYF